MEGKKEEHQLGRIIYDGTPLPNTGIPGMIGGYAKQLVLYAPETRSIEVLQDIGSRVNKGDVVTRTGHSELVAPTTGSVRGMIPNQTTQ